MAANQKPKSGDFEKALKYLDEEAHLLTELSKNLTESWKNKSDRHWVPEVMFQQMKEKEERFQQIRSLIRVEKGSKGETATIPSACQTHQEQIKQLEKNNEKLLQNLQKREKELTDLKEGKLLPEVQSRLQVDNQEKKPFVTFKIQKAEKFLNAHENVFMERMMDLESKFEKEKADLKSEKRKCLEKINILETRIQELEKENSELTEGLQVDKQEKKPLSTFKDNMGNTLKSKYDVGKDRRQDENIILDVENAGEVGGKKAISFEIQGQTQQYEETKTNNSMPTQHEGSNANDANNAVEEKWKHRCREIEKEKRQLIEIKNMLQEQNDSLQAYTKQLKEEKDELLLRLSKNPAIIDLSDPNRPTKLAEYYSELYDNEWTDALEALKIAGYDEISATETLRLTLENVLQFCEKKAELLLKKISDAVNLLFKDYEQSVIEMKVPSHLTIPRQNALRMGEHLRREQLSLDDIKLQHMWKPKLEKGGQKSYSENVNKTENIKVEAENKLKTLRKEMASTMVPFVQKAYMEASWSKECIDEVKPFILKCLYLGWMMKVQSPPMVFHKCDMEAMFDKNLYKEYISSGQLVSYVVWPALLLYENGPIVCKGVAEGKKIQN